MNGHWHDPLSFALLCTAIFFIIIPLNTLIHEMGHAVVIARITRKRVCIYLGSYGNEENSWRISAGLFDIYVRKDPLRWRGGLCKPVTPAQLTTKQKIAFILGGPVATVLLFLILLSLFLFIRPEGFPALFLLAFCVYAGVSLTGNIIPGGKAISLQAGNLTYNDGAMLRKLLQERKMPAAYFEAEQYFRDRRYAEAATKAIQLIDGQLYNVTLYQMAVISCIMIKDYERADALQREQIKRFGRLDTHDQIHKAMLKIHLGQHTEAIAYLKHLLEQHGPNKYNLNNLGYVLQLEGLYAESIPYLDKAVKTDSRFVYAYCNRAYALLQLGFTEQGKADNDVALALDADNAHALRNAGLYYLKLQQYAPALHYLEKAYTLDPGIAGLLSLIETAKKGPDEAGNVHLKAE